MTVRAETAGAPRTRRVASEAAKRFKRAAVSALDLVDGDPRHARALEVARGGYWASPWRRSSSAPIAGTSTTC